MGSAPIDRRGSYPDQMDDMMRNRQQSQQQQQMNAQGQIRYPLQNNYNPMRQPGYK